MDGLIEMAGELLTTALITKSWKWFLACAVSLICIFGWIFYGGGRNS